MRLDAVITSVIVFSLFVTGGVLIWNDMISEYDLNVTTDEYKNVYNTSSEMYDLSQDVKNKTLEAEAEGGDESWESLVKGSYSAIRLISSSFVMIGDILDAIAKELGVPKFFIQAAMTLLMVAIAFSVIYLIFRFKG
jgi:hypothetical protein